MPDIDIDFQTTFDPRRVIKQAIPASMVKNGVLSKHPCGHYFQSIPVDSITQLAAIPYEEAEAVGYFKIDFLHLSTLDNFKSKDEIRRLIAIPPKWDLLLDQSVVERLFQISRHHELLYALAPQSVDELADCIALIRPSKIHLIDRYIKATNQGRGLLRVPLYTKPTNGKNWFKRAHAIAYSLTIVLQLHLIAQGRL